MRDRDPRFPTCRFFGSFLRIFAPQVDAEAFDPGCERSMRVFGS